MVKLKLFVHNTDLEALLRLASSAIQNDTVCCIHYIHRSLASVIFSLDESNSWDILQVMK